jgi:hypothetical protein
MGPALLAATPHSVMAAGYHRNHEAMRDVILAFLGPEERARSFAEARSVSLIVYCSNLMETERYMNGAPDGFMARLNRGQVPAWLEPVPGAGSSTLKVWRIRPRA